MEQLFKRLVGLSNTVAWITESISALLMAVIIVVNMLAVIFRYGLNNPIGWSEEVMRYGMIWAVYLVVGSSILRGEDMTVDLIKAIPSRTVRRIANIIVLFVTLLLSAVILIYGIPFIMDTGQVSPSMRIPMAFPYAAVVVGYFLIACQTIAKFINMKHEEQS